MVFVAKHIATQKPQCFPRSRCFWNRSVMSECLPYLMIISTVEEISKEFHALLIFAAKDLGFPSLHQYIQ